MGLLAVFCDNHYKIWTICQDSKDDLHLVAGTVEYILTLKKI